LAIFVSSGNFPLTNAAEAVRALFVRFIETTLRQAQAPGVKWIDAGQGTTRTPRQQQPDSAVLYRGRNRAERSSTSNNLLKASAESVARVALRVTRATAVALVRQFAAKQ
jgi:hypothetical protein